MQEKVIRIGRYASLFLIAIFQSLPAASDIVSLAALDVRGREIKTVAVGEPFFIEVVVATESYASVPQLVTDAAIEATLQGSSTRIYTTNGVRTATKNYHYRACAHDEGTFTLGPAKIMIASQEHRSPVKQLQVTVNETAPVSADKRVYLEISVDKKKVVPGESMVFSLRVYMADEFVHIDGINEPSFKDCTHGSLEGPIQGQVEVDGVVYKYLEWKTTFYAHKSGTLLIPAVAAQVTIETRRADQIDRSLDFFGMVNSLLGTHIEREQLISNALKIEVVPFPEHEKKVTAFGAFSSLTAKANVESAAQSEGIVYTLELVGQGNFAMISHPKLSLPDGLRYYESKSTMHALGAGISKKDFEYIIQGAEPGSYKIQSQEFVFLDAQKRTYKTLRTKPIKLTITPGASVAAAERVAELETESESTQASVVSGLVQDLEPLEENTWRDIPLHSLSYITFITSLIFLAFAFGIGLIVRCALYFRRKRDPKRIRNNAFKHAYKQLDILEKEQNVRGVYPLILHVFSVRSGVLVSDITQEYLVAFLQAAHIPIERLRAWNDFLHDVMAANYSGSTGLHDAQIAALFEATRVWLHYLEDKV